MLIDDRPCIASGWHYVTYRIDAIPHLPGAVRQAAERQGEGRPGSAERALDLIEADPAADAVDGLSDLT